MGFNLGAFAGGMSKGIESGQELMALQKRMQLADDSNKREQTRFDNEQTDREKLLKIELEKSNFIKSIYEGTENHFAVGESDGDGYSIQPTQQAALPVVGTSDGNGYQVQQPGNSMSVKTGGVDPFAKGNEGKLLQLYTGMFSIDSKHGKFDSAYMEKLRSLRQQMDKDGDTEAMQKFMLSNDPAHLTPIAERLNIVPGSLKLVAKPGKAGVLVPTFTGYMNDESKTPFEREATTFTNALGLDGISAAFDKQRSNDRAERQLEITDSYYKGRVKAAQDAAAKKAAGQQGYDEKRIRDIVGNIPTNYSKQSGMIGPDGKAPKDQWAHNETYELATRLAATGKYNEVEAVRFARDAVKKVTEFANQQDDWSKPGGRKDVILTADGKQTTKWSEADRGYDGFRKMALDAMITRYQNEKAGGQAPAPEPSAPPAPTGTRIADAAPTAGQRRAPTSAMAETEAAIQRRIPTTRAGAVAAAGKQSDRAAVIESNVKAEPEKPTALKSRYPSGGIGHEDAYLRKRKAERATREAEEKQKQEQRAARPKAPPQKDREWVHVGYKAKQVFDAQERKKDEERAVVKRESDRIKGEEQSAKLAEAEQTYDAAVKKLERAKTPDQRFIAKRDIAAAKRAIENAQ